LESNERVSLELVTADTCPLVVQYEYFACPIDLNRLVVRYYMKYEYKITG
jgi:hypothetical protein